jgi:hypothetical protein
MRTHPEDAENAGQSADIAVREPKVSRDEGEQRRDDPPIETDEAETETEQGNGLPLVVDVPLTARRRAWLYHVRTSRCRKTAIEASQEPVATGLWTLYANPAAAATSRPRRHAPTPGQATRHAGGGVVVG